MTAITRYWTLLFAAAGVLILGSGPLHPDGTMLEALRDPAWVPMHLAFLAGIAAFLAGMYGFARSAPLPRAVARWQRAALVASWLFVVEMIFHTAAAVDHANLAAGRVAPILFTHLGLAVVCYPIFGVTVAGFIVATSRAGVLGSRWAAPLGVLGVGAFGIAAPLAAVLPDYIVDKLFPLIVLFGLWLVVTGAHGWLQERRGVMREAV